jgi:hypothetical protein
MTLASATTAAGSEIVEHLFFGGASVDQLRADLLGQAQEDFTADLKRELFGLPWEEEAGRRAVASDEDHVLGAEHLAGAVAKVAYAHNLHVGTSVVTWGW